MIVMMKAAVAIVAGGEDFMAVLAMTKAVMSSAMVTLIVVAVMVTVVAMVTPLVAVAALHQQWQPTTAAVAVTKTTGATAMARHRQQSTKHRGSLMAATVAVSFTPAAAAAAV